MTNSSQEINYLKRVLLELHDIISLLCGVIVCK